MCFICSEQRKGWENTPVWFSRTGTCLSLAASACALGTALAYRVYVHSTEKIRVLQYGFSYAFIVYAATMTLLSAVAHASSMLSVFHRRSVRSGYGFMDEESSGKEAPTKE